MTANCLWAELFISQKRLKGDSSLWCKVSNVREGLKFILHLERGGPTALLCPQQPKGICLAGWPRAWVRKEACPSSQGWQRSPVPAAKAKMEELSSETRRRWQGGPQGGMSDLVTRGQLVTAPTTACPKIIIPTVRKALPGCSGVPQQKAASVVSKHKGIENWR